MRIKKQYCFRLYMDFQIYTFCVINFKILFWEYIYWSKYKFYNRMTSAEKRNVCKTPGTNRYSYSTSLLIVIKNVHYNRRVNVLCPYTNCP